MMLEELRDYVERAVKEYNLYRSPEAEAEIIGFGEGRFTVMFKGPFCQSCGLYDYFEDLIYIMKEKWGIELEITDIEENNGLFQVEYRIKRS